MSTLIPIVTTLFRPADPTAERMPRALTYALALTTFFFIGSNGAASGITNLLIATKWGPLALLTVVGFVLIGSLRRIPRMPIAVLVPLATLLFVAFAGCVLGINPGHSMFAVATVLISVLAGYLISAVIVATDSRASYYELIANFGRGVVIVTAILFVLRINLGRGGGLNAWTDNPNTLAGILAPSLVMFLAGCIERRPGWKIRHLSFLIVGTYLMWATDSRASMIWLAVSGMAFWIYRRGFALVSTTMMVLLVAGLIWLDPIRDYLIEVMGLNWNPANGISPLSGREEVWRVGWMLFPHRPILGYGMGTSQELVAEEAWRFVRHQGLHFHSSYIQSLVETGLLGFSALMGAIVMTLGRGLSDSSRTAVLPREGWVMNALPWALILGALGQAAFESWLLSAGNVNTLGFWTWFWIVHHQAQIPVRAVAALPAGQGARDMGGTLALPARQ